jgi:hypothetical protein
MGFMKENKKKFTKRNEILLLTKRYEISLFILFRETSEISRNNFVVSLCFVFRETKKGCEMETLTKFQDSCFFFKEYRYRVPVTFKTVAEPKPQRK